MKVLALTVALALGCGGRAIVQTDEAGDTTTAATGEGSTWSSSTGTTSVDTSTSAGTTMTTDDSSSGAASSSGRDDSNFLAEADAPLEDCDPWIENCPAGMKCMPWANDNSWSALKCVEIARDPNQPGEPCTVEGSGLSGIDDCDLHSMCWNVDPETNIGTCIEMCVGSPHEPGCAAPCQTCSILANGVLILCLPVCDPITQTGCGDGEACYPYGGGFVCAIEPPGGSAGEPCEYVNACDAGLLCAPLEQVPGCIGPYGCCTEFCDPSQPSESQCTLFAQGAQCLPYFDGPTVIDACTESEVGACVLP